MYSPSVGRSLCSTRGLLTTEPSLGYPNVVVTHVLNALGTPKPTAVQHRHNILGCLAISVPPEYCHILTNCRHRNLTKPIGMCGSGSSKFLPFAGRSTQLLETLRI